MGFHLITDGERALSAVSFATPKTHTPDSRLQERGQRYYSPSLGRWLSRDPIKERGGINLYAFVRNSPVNSFDPRGLTDFSKAEARFTTHPAFFLKLTAVKGEDCALVNFIQLLKYRTGQSTKNLQLDPGTPPLDAPLYYDKTSVPFSESQRDVKYPQEIEFGDSPSSWPEIDKPGESMNFLVLVVDAFPDRAEILGAVAWAYVGKEHDTKFWLYGAYRNATKEEVDKAVQVLTPNNFKPFGGNTLKGGYKIDASKFKALPGIQQQGTFMLREMNR
jgi:RHS repeat-associated protein